MLKEIPMFRVPSTPPAAEPEGRLDVTWGWDYDDDDDVLDSWLASLSVDAFERFLDQLTGEPVGVSSRLESTA
jgi:hypothetical protein